MSQPLAARTAAVDLPGKKLLRMETAVPEEMKSAATAFWRLSGFASEAQWLRSLVSRELYGSFGTVQSIVQRNPVVLKPGNRG